MDFSKDSQEYLKCKICFEWFDEKIHRPLILLCGHTFCQNCLLNIFEGSLITCPMDKKIFEYTTPKDVGTNYSLLEKITKEQYESRVTCEEHGKMVHFFCKTDKKYACKNCVLQYHTGTNHELLPAQKIIELTEFVNELPKLVDRLEDAISFTNFQLKIMGLHKENFIKREKKAKEEIQKFLEGYFSERKEKVIEMYQGINDSLNKRLSKLREEKQKALITLDKCDKWEDFAENTLKDPIEIRKKFEHEIKIGEAIYLPAQQKELIDFMKAEVLYHDLLASLKKEVEKSHQDIPLEEIVTAENMKGVQNLAPNPHFFPYLIMNPYTVRSLTEFRKNKCYDVVLNALMNLKDLASYYITSKENVTSDSQKVPFGNAIQGLFKEFWLGTKTKYSKKELKEILNEKTRDPFELTLNILRAADQDMHITYQIKKQQKMIQELFKGVFRHSNSGILCHSCKTNSDKIICPFVLDLNIPKFRVLVQGFFYLIFLNPEALPLKVHFSLPQEFHAEDLYLGIKEKLNISSECLELYLMKDHILIEKPNKKVSLKYLKKHEGLLIFYQIKESKGEENWLLKSNYNAGEESKIMCEIIIKQATSSKPKNVALISFPRLIQVLKGESLENLHLRIYNMMRHFLKEARFIFEEEEGDSFFKTHIGQIGNEFDLKKEYTELFETSGKEKPYELLFQRKKNNPSNENDKIPYDKYDAYNYFKNFEENNNISIQLHFSPYILRNNLKINRCHESNKTISFNARTHKYSLEDCLKTFQDEVLQRNKFYCDNCYSIQKTPLVFDDIILFPKILIVTFRSKFSEENGTESNTIIHYPVNEDLNISTFLKKSEFEIDKYYELCAVINIQRSVEEKNSRWDVLIKNYKSQEWFKMREGKFEKIEKDQVCSKDAYLLVFIRK